VRAPASIARAVVLGLWTYYLVYALAAPVVLTDAHLYDLARLYVIRQGGLLHNDVFTTFTQIVFPWAFTAIHWPLVRLGFGYALPSFACLTGILIVTFLQLGPAYGAEIAWVACLALLALPTLVYQATSIKPDLAVVFGVFCWFHSLRRHLGEGRRSDLALSALALAFAAGAKTSGVPIAAALGGLSVFALRHERRQAAAWVGCVVLCAALFGSIETYVASEMTYGNYLGPNGLQMLRNNDGWAGAAANLIRHVAYNVDLGTDVLADHKWVLSAAAEAACHRILVVLGLDAKGIAPAMGRLSMDFVKSGYEAQDGFGPLGTIAMVVVPVVLLRARRRSAPWQLALGSVLALALVCRTTGFNLWVNRFLMLPFVLGTLATVTYLAPRWHRSAAFRVGALIVLLYGSCVLPLFSFARKPVDIWRSVTDRDAMTTMEMPESLPALRTVRAVVATCPTSFWVVTAAPLARQFLFYDLLRDREILSWPVAVNGARLAEVQAAHPGRPIRVLTIHQPLFEEPAALHLTELASFPGGAPAGSPTRIFRYGEDGCPVAALPPRM
jgi:hypothetical protein